MVPVAHFWWINHRESSIKNAKQQKMLARMVPDVWQNVSKCLKIKSKGPFLLDLSRSRSLILSKELGTSVWALAPVKGSTTRHPNHGLNHKI